MSQIGRYEIVRQTGSLYLAFDPVMQRPVTIRIAEARQAKQLALLEHPNIIKFLACEEDDGRPYLVMERFDGKPIGARLSREVLARVLKKAALALDHAHSKGLIHRNLTPESLLLDDDEILKITGFEIARPAQYLGEDLDLLLDSIHYMSPELVKGDVLDSRSDQYSLGVIAWRALTGALPFHSESPITLLKNIAFEPPALGGVSSAVTKVFARALANFPGERFASSGEFASAFENALSVRDAAPVFVAPRPAPPEERKSLLPWIVGAIAVVVFIMVGAIVMLRPARSVAPVVKTAPAPEIVPAPPPVVEAKPKPRVAKRIAPAVKDTTPEAPRMKPLEPKVVH
jgi:serine/threonine protein kinase